MRQGGLEFDLIFAELERAVATGAPYALLGASYSFVPLLDEMRRRGETFALPAGSRMFDTGGFKGQSRDVALDDFYNQLSTGFGVPRQHVRHDRAQHLVFRLGQ